MIINDVDTFLHYYERIRHRTLRVIQCIPPDKIDWTYQTGKFTLGDLVRHLATIERYMYAENAQFKPSRYPGCDESLAAGYENVMKFLNDLHEESMMIFKQLTNEDLQKKTLTPGGAEIRLWKWLRAMIEHEVHHRGQIYIYLGMLNVPTPPLYGLTSEEVLSKTKSF